MGLATVKQTSYCMFWKNWLGEVRVVRLGELRELRGRLVWLVGELREMVWGLVWLGEHDDSDRVVPAEVGGLVGGLHGQ